MANMSFLEVISSANAMQDQLFIASQTWQKPKKILNTSQWLKRESSWLSFHQKFTKKCKDLLVFSIISSLVASGIVLREKQNKTMKQKTR